MQRNSGTLERGLGAVEYGLEARVHKTSEHGTLELRGEVRCMQPSTERSPPLAAWQAFVLDSSVALRVSSVDKASVERGQSSKPRIQSPTTRPQTRPPLPPVLLAWGLSDSELSHRPTEKQATGDKEEQELGRE